MLKRINKISRSVLTFMIAFQFAFIPSAQAISKSYVPSADFLGKLKIYSQLPTLGAILGAAKIGFSKEDFEFLEKKVKSLGYNLNSLVKMSVTDQMFTVSDGKLQTAFKISGDSLVSGGSVIKWAKVSAEESFDAITKIVGQGAIGLAEGYGKLTNGFTLGDHQKFIGFSTIIGVVATGLIAGALGFSVPATPVILGAAIAIGALWYYLSQDSRARSTYSSPDSMVQEICKYPERVLAKQWIPQNAADFVRDQIPNLCKFSKEVLLKINQSGLAEEFSPREKDLVPKGVK